MEKEIHETLLGVRELLSDPGRWLQGENARDVEGRPVAPNAPQAVCWCLVGAICRVAAGHVDIQNAARVVVWEHTGNLLVTEYNDTHDHAAVLALLDRALQEAS